MRCVRRGLGCAMLFIVVTSCGDETSGSDAAADADGSSMRDSSADAFRDAVVDSTTDGGGDTSTPADTGPPPDGCARVRSVSTGGRFSCAVTDGGRLFCWGLGEDGRLGLGDDAMRLWPEQVGTDASWVSVSCGLAHACAIRADGSLWCWGANDSRQLGTGDRTMRATPTEIDASNAWAQVATGSLHTCGRRDDSTLHCWGAGSRGQTSVLPRAGAVAVPTEVTGGGTFADANSGMSHSCAIREDGTASCTGFNNTGQLGLGDEVDRDSLEQIGADTTWTDVDAALFHTCGISGGELRCWGANGGNALGQGPGLAQDVHQLTPLAVAGPADWVQVSTGELQTCGVRVDGTLWCWGFNGDGQLGVGDLSSRSEPTRVGTETDWRVVEVTAQLHTFGGFRNQVCGIRGDDELHCWGANQEGQLGLGDTMNRDVPTRLCIPWP